MWAIEDGQRYTGCNEGNFARTALSARSFSISNCPACDGALRFAKSYGDHMVLQRGPQRAVIWGYTDKDFQTISADIDGINGTVTTISVNGMWKLKLNPMTDEGPFNITVSTKAEGNITLHDVLFGDVWICSGAANMGFSMSRVNDSDNEISSAMAYNKIRILHVLYEESDASLIDLQTLHTPWSIPTEDLVSNFSAVCYLYGEYISRHHNYPIGLIETDSDDNDTSIQSWISSSSVTRCGKPTRNDTSGAYNSMINPLLTMTIYGAIWFQGESDIEEANKYGCHLQTLINDWRTLSHHFSLSETSNTFPFGIVQIGPNFHNYNVIGPVPDLRWSQTAKVGYLPNPTLPNTFLAITFDLPEFTPTSHRLHPKYKQDVAERLGLASLAVAYGVKGIYYQGPFPTSYKYSKRFDELTIEYDHGKTVLDVRVGAFYFDVCCSRNSTTTCGPHDSWVSTFITEHSDTTVTIATLSCYERHVVGVRYNWRESPCEFKMCQIYGRDNDLPAPQFSVGVALW
ncbi:hypothetical protein LOTGIDRAFT_169504 [Lottia gigantea]|uniref:Sialate O-acetylesterase domain-containing protein n=1 Tax=Lottia gigantea TaxID=225164 RepID=V4B4C5_LOTGI|nr:hypothetical protein LOTGIDRAFT_169504 [Lottia gigantea]ESO83284.1 hypothetical protein LOTGIDRAFT_169504 [Lottia gigantea]